MPVTDGEVAVANNLTLTIVQWRASEGTNGWIRLRRTGAGRFDTYFATTGLYPNTDLIIQTAADSRTVLPIGGAFGGGANWVVPDAAGSQLIALISTGDPFIIAIAEPASAPSVSIAAAIESGVPTMTARIRTVAPGAVHRGGD